MKVEHLNYLYERACGTHCPHCALTAPSQRPRCTLTAPSLRPHCALTAPSLHALANTAVNSLNSYMHVFLYYNFM